MYDSLADNYNNYGTSSRSSFYSKFQAGSGSWGYPVRSCFLGTCRHGPWFEQEKASWLLRRRWGAAGSPGETPHSSPVCLLGHYFTSRYCSLLRGRVGISKCIK